MSSEKSASRERGENKSFLLSNNNVSVSPRSSADMFQSKNWEEEMTEVSKKTKHRIWDKEK